MDCQLPTPTSPPSCSQFFLSKWPTSCLRQYCGIIFDSFFSLPFPIFNPPANPSACINIYAYFNPLSLPTLIQPPPSSCCIVIIVSFSSVLTYHYSSIRRTARVILSLWTREITPLFNILHWLLISHTIRAKVLTLPYKALRDTLPTTPIHTYTHYLLLH